MSRTGTWVLAGTSAAAVLLAAALGLSALASANAEERPVAPPAGVPTPAEAVPVPANTAATEDEPREGRGVVATTSTNFYTAREEAASRDLHRLQTELRGRTEEERLLALRRFAEQFSRTRAAGQAAAEADHLTGRREANAASELAGAECAARRLEAEDRLYDALLAYQEFPAQYAHSRAGATAMDRARGLRARLDRRFEEDRRRVNAALQANDFAAARAVFAAVATYGDPDQRELARRQVARIDLLAADYAEAATAQGAARELDGYPERWTTLKEMVRRREYAQAVALCERWLAGVGSAAVQEQLRTDLAALELMDSFRQRALEGIRGLGADEPVAFRLRNGSARGRVASIEGTRIVLSVERGEQAFDLEDLSDEDLARMARRGCGEDRGAYHLMHGVSQLYRGEVASARSSLERAERAGADVQRFLQKMERVAPNL